MYPTAKMSLHRKKRLLRNQLKNTFHVNVKQENQNAANPNQIDLDSLIEEPELGSFQYTMAAPEQPQRTLNPSQIEEIQNQQYQYAQKFAMSFHQEEQEETKFPIRVKRNEEQFKTIYHHMQFNMQGLNKVAGNGNTVEQGKAMNTQFKQKHQKGVISKQNVTEILAININNIQRIETKESISQLPEDRFIPTTELGANFIDAVAQNQTHLQELSFPFRVEKYSKNFYNRKIQHYHPNFKYALPIENRSDRLKVQIPCFGRGNTLYLNLSLVEGYYGNIKQEEALLKPIESRIINAVRIIESMEFNKIKIEDHNVTTRYSQSRADLYNTFNRYNYDRTIGYFVEAFMGYLLNSLDMLLNDESLSLCKLSNAISYYIKDMSPRKHYQSYLIALSQHAKITYEFIGDNYQQYNDNYDNLYEFLRLNDLILLTVITLCGVIVHDLPPYLYFEFMKDLLFNTENVNGWYESKLTSDKVEVEEEKLEKYITKSLPKVMKDLNRVNHRWVDHILFRTDN